MAVYDLLASHYDVLTGDPAAEAEFISGLIERRRRGAVTLLDVACGTGGITRQLASSYQVTGLDISPGMLAIARQKLPGEVPLHLADMTCFELDGTFDVAVCAYQGVNHLYDFSAWESFFGCVHRHLSDGGLLVFDIATVSHLRAVAGMPRRVRRFGGNYVQVRVRTSDDIVFTWNVEVFELQPDGRHKRLTEVFTMSSFPLGAIREALRQRFTDVETFDRQGDTISAETQARTWFACTKAGTPERRR